MKNGRERERESDLGVRIRLELLGIATGGRVLADLLVILLEGGKVLAGLGELALLHTLTDVPVDEGTLGVHEVELVVQARPGLGDGGGVGEHADGPGDLGDITSGDDDGGLVVDANLEAGGAPVDELDGLLGLDVGNGAVDVLGDDVSAVEEAAGHVLAVAGVALDHLVVGLEAGVGDLRDGELLVVGLLSRDDGGEVDEGEVDAGVGDQVGLELSEVDVQGAIEAEGGGDGGDDLADEAVEVEVGGALNAEVPAADVVDGLVVDEEGDVRVLEGGVGVENRVVGLDDRGGDGGGGVDGELELALLAVVDREALHEEGAEAGAGSTTEGVEDEEALEAAAVVGEPADPVDDVVNHLLANGVVTAGVVVGGILLAGDELLGVEELLVGAPANLVNDTGLEVDEDGTGDVLAGTSLGEEGGEGIVALTDGLGGEGAVGLNSVLEAVELPAGVTDLKKKK